MNSSTNCSVCVILFCADSKGIAIRGRFHSPKVDWVKGGFAMPTLDPNGTVLQLAFCDLRGYT